MTESLPDVLAPAAQSQFPHRARALLGLFAVPGASLDELKSALMEWQRERSALAQQPPELLRVGVRIAGTEENLQQSVGSYFGETITPLDAFVTVDIDIDQPGLAELDALVARLGSVGDQLPGVVDRGRSFALAGLVNLVLDGDGPFAMMLVCTHHPDVELVDAHAWWCSFGEVVHAASAQGHTLGYHQVQCDPELSSRAARGAGVSATSLDLGDLVYLRDVNEFAAAARPQARSGVDPGSPVNQRDEFITFRGSVGAFCLMLGG